MPYRTLILLAALGLPPPAPAAQAQSAPAPRPELGPRIGAALKAMTRAYAPFHAGLKDRRPREAEKKLAAISSAVDAASELLNEMEALRRRSSGDPAAASSETAATLLEIKAALEEADDDRRDLRQEIKAFGKFLGAQAEEVPKEKITAFRKSISRPYKDLYWNLQQLKDRCESLPPAAP